MRVNTGRRDARQPSSGCHPHDLREHWCGLFVFPADKGATTTNNSDVVKNHAPLLAGLKATAPRVAPRALTPARRWRALSNTTPGASVTSLATKRKPPCS